MYNRLIVLLKPTNPLRRKFLVHRSSFSILREARSSEKDNVRKVWFMRNRSIAWRLWRIRRILGLRTWTNFNLTVSK